MRLPPRDPAGNLKLDKAKSRQMIDGMSALVNAIAGMTADPSAWRIPVYEDPRGSQWV